VFATVRGSKPEELRAEPQVHDFLGATVAQPTPLLAHTDGAENGKVERDRTGKVENREINVMNAARRHLSLLCR
jgi:hypothetical protein